MNQRYTRREVLLGIATASAASVLPAGPLAEAERSVGQEDFEITLTPVSAYAFRLTILPWLKGGPAPLPTSGSLARTSWGPPLLRSHGDFACQSVKAGELKVTISRDPLEFLIETASGARIQRLKVEAGTGVLSFETGNSPLLGLGEGGPQFDRRGSTDSMHSGQGGYKLATHGGRVPIPWIIGTSGWAMFVHQPCGAFDFTRAESKFQPATGEPALPLDLFFVGASRPETIMAEYARITGHAEMPPLWAFGYQQSHRTLASREEVLAEAKMFREKKLPCDAMIYLGTGFCPSGWNTQNGSFVWNDRVFPQPKAILDELHEHHLRVIPHVVILSDKLQGTVHDPCELKRFDESQASCHWDAHRKVFAAGVDGWWPDEGDSLDAASRLVRNRMYWDGPQIDRPNERPYALHRNGCAGMQRYGSFLWSGDVDSSWDTLKIHVPIAINTALSGIPYWGTDIGGFVPTKEFTAELYVRWFQFGAFCTLFRCHGRNWKLRLPWGWNTGDPGPLEISSYRQAAIPDRSQLHNPQVEAICRKYLNLRYRMLPYLYSAVHECATTGMPIVRALWLHYPEDRTAVAREDEYLWGRSVLVAPVVAKAAESRQVYLPGGSWYDFWTGERLEGGREITRAIELETMPLYVRSGSILPLGPIKQYVDEKVDEPLSLSVYPGTDASFLLYEDDGKSFDYRKGHWMGTEMTWNDRRRVLTLRLAQGSGMRPPSPRSIEVKVMEASRRVEFDGRPLDVRF